MRTGGRKSQAVLGRKLRGGATQPAQARNRLLDRLAHRRRQLDHGGVQLGLERSRQVALRRAAHEHVDRRRGLERRGVQDHQLFLDPERERRAIAEVSLDHVLPRMPCTGRPAASHA